MEVGRLRRAVKLSSLRPISSSGTSTFDAAESYGFSDRLPVVTVRPHAPVLLSSPPLILSPRMREPALDIHLCSPGTDRCAYRCPLAGARCPDTSSSRAAPSWRLSLRPGAHRLRFAPPFTVPHLSPPLAVLTPMASMPPIYISPGGGEGIHHASRHLPPSGGPALTGWRETSTSRCVLWRRAMTGRMTGSL